MSKLLEGKVALVTGAGRGIGREIALALATSGARVMVNDLGVSLKGEDATEAPALEVVRAIREAGGTAEHSFGNVAIADDAREMVQHTIAELGGLDIVVNNAGILRDAIFHKMTDADWNAVLQVHLYGSFNVSRAAAENFRQQNRGAFVHMT